MVVHPHYQDRRRNGLNELKVDELDAPIAELVDDLCKFSFCWASKAALATFFILTMKIPTILNRCRRQVESTLLSTELPISRYVSRIVYDLAIVFLKLKTQPDGTYS
jgi:hypothetical protein